MIYHLTILDCVVLAVSIFVLGIGCGAVGLSVVASWWYAGEPTDELLPHHQPDFVDRDLINAASLRTKP